MEAVCVDLKNIYKCTTEGFVSFCTLFLKKRKNRISMFCLALMRLDLNYYIPHQDVMNIELVVLPEGKLVIVVRVCLFFVVVIFCVCFFYISI